jgi:hypothetical protein
MTDKEEPKAPAAPRGEESSARPRPPVRRLALGLWPALAALAREGVPAVRVPEPPPLLPQEPVLVDLPLRERLGAQLPRPSRTEDVVLLSALPRTLFVQAPSSCPHACSCPHHAKMRAKLARRAARQVRSK